MRKRCTLSCSRRCFPVFLFYQPHATPSVQVRNKKGGLQCLMICRFSTDFARGGGEDFSGVPNHVNYSSGKHTARCINCRATKIVWKGVWEPDKRRHKSNFCVDPENRIFNTFFKQKNAKKSEFFPTTAQARKFFSKCFCIRTQIPVFFLCTEIETFENVKFFKFQRPFTNKHFGARWWLQSRVWRSKYPWNLFLSIQLQSKLRHFTFYHLW